jgi:hypothetical protein
VRRGERVEGITGVVVTTKLGKAAVLRPALLWPSEFSLKPGEVVYIINDRGERFWKVWVRGHLGDAEILRKDEECYPGDDNDCPGLQMIEEPKTVWWAKIRNRRGQEGWTRHHLARFGDIDACG